MSNKIYPIGIQNFESLRQDGYFYIDKTALIHQLVKTGNYYFLAVRVVLAKACLFLGLKPISKESVNYLLDWLWRSWKKTG